MHGSGAPWIEIEPPGYNQKLIDQARRIWDQIEKTKSRKTSKAVIKLYQKYNNLFLQASVPVRLHGQRLLELLNQFYQHHFPRYDRQIFIDFRQQFYQITNHGAFYLEVADQKTKAVRLNEYQEEVELFTQFLKENFFHG